MKKLLPLLLLVLFACSKNDGETKTIFSLIVDASREVMLALQVVIMKKV